MSYCHLHTFSNRSGANKAFSFFCAGEYTDANDAKVERIESHAALEENCYIWKHYLAEIDKKRKAAEVSHTENRRINRKSSNKAFSASRAKSRMLARNLTSEFDAGNIFELVCFLKLL